ncbi:MAG: N-acetylmuramoyl-L-alanine amidase [Alphaproteobacteria bacterium]
MPGGLTAMQIIARPSPNYNDRAPGAIDMLVLHYTGMVSREHALARLCDPKAKVSAHYLIDEMGLVYQLVAEDRRAWHAGVSGWAGERDINSRSIGIELVNPGHDLGYRNFTGLQMRSLAELCHEILARHPIPPHCVLGHGDVAPGRKRDPGELFDWRWLAGQGVGIWPEAASYNSNREPDILNLQESLKRYGYDVPQTGIYGTQTGAVVTAFQRHFRPANVDGRADAQTASILQHLLQRITA